MNTRIIAGFLVLGCFIGAIACNQQKPQEEESLEAAIEPDESITMANIDADAEFALQMAERNLLDIQLGELAQARASSKWIKRLANDMVATHREANNELKAWASARGLMLSDELSEKNQVIYDELAEREGADFDEAYSDYLVADHKQDIRKLERESENGNDADLRTWAAKKIPVWQNNLNKAEEAEDTADEKDK